MKTTAALLYEQPGRWEIEEVELDGPQQGEVLVEMVSTGLCHSDDHQVTGDMRAPVLPLCGGHEGGAIVREVGPGVVGLAVGDHIITSFIPACGKCAFCAAGRQNLCRNGALIGTGTQLDGTFRMHNGAGDIGTFALLGTFSQFQVLDQLSCVKVDPDLPLNVLCLLACGVPTGWGSAINAAAVKAGDVVVVMGSGGVGINAVQGAAFVGARAVIVVDPVAFKQETALKLGASHAFSSMEEALPTVHELTDYQGAASAVVTIGVVRGAHVRDAFSAVRKGGTVVVTGVAPIDEPGPPISLAELCSYEKRLQGSLYGSSSPRAQIPVLSELYRTGQLKVDELVTKRYRLDQINEAYTDMRDGKNIRGVIDFAAD